MFPKPLQYAIRIAEANETYPMWRLGSVIIKGGSVQAVGQSRLNTHPNRCDELSVHENRDKISVHAEQDALRRCGNPRKAVLYIARIGRSGKVGLAKPCPNCRNEIRSAGIKKVIYTVSPHKYSTWVA